MYSDSFVSIFNNTMFYEVGPWWDPTNPDVIAGKIGTSAQRRNVGFVNVPGDTGGVTKFGIAQNSHKSINVEDIDLNDAMGIYYQEYWLDAKADRIVKSVAASYFDICVNMGNSRGAKILQQAVKTDVDGIIGPKSLQLVNCANEDQLIESISNLREARYRAIVAANKSQSKFLMGWLRRNIQVTMFSKSLIGK